MGLKYPINLCIDIIKQLSLTMQMKCFMWNCVLIFFLELLLINWDLYVSPLKDFDFFFFLF